MLFLASKKVRIVKITSLQVPITGGKSPYTLMVFGKPKQNGNFSKKCSPKNTLMSPLSRISPEIASFLF